MKVMPLVLVLVLALGSVAAASAAGDVGWQAAAKQDLTAMHDLLRDNHPAVYVDKDSAHFRKWLDEGMQQALAALPRVDDAYGYYYLLRRYAAGFRDGHIQMGLKDKAFYDLQTVAWPGFATAWQDGKYFVAYVLPDAAASAPPKGAVLISCDGQTAEVIARARLDLYEGDLDLEYGRHNYAPVLLWDHGNPFVSARFRKCLFDVNGRHRNYALIYRSDPESVLKTARDMAKGHVEAKLDVQPWGANSWWLTIPSMGDNQDWKSFFAKVDANIGALRATDLVVLDVRGNGGGSSSYADRLAEKFYGADFAHAHAPHLGSIVYRVTPLNRKFFADLIVQFQNDPLFASDIPEWKEIVDGFDKAAAAQQPTFQSADDSVAPFDPAKAQTNLMKGKVVILTDYSCSSACLDLMDLFMAMPNVEQAGNITNADTIFMELTQVDLPSGQGKFAFGHKAWIERPRGSNVSYSPSPALTYHGDPNDEAALRAWLANAMR